MSANKFSTGNNILSRVTKSISYLDNFKIYSRFFGY